ncbi:MAG: sulfite exporter TauE/SafE family protein [Nocardioidaceae bacterium]|nr:sulfite exporter TauE/SafE family protein [Nocardioidaceae bacterium]MCL2612809.1 sulfite exporter TauE/SafE family protein [Nocardioidaceae bacterium]
MSPIQAVAVTAAGVVAGGVNTIVGSGSLLTFPTLLAVGYSPVVANVSNTVGICGGTISGTFGYRRELRGQRRRALGFGSASLLGAIVGVVLLLRLPGSVFASVVPVLILLACALIAAQPWIARRLAGVRTQHLGIAGYVGIFLTGVYGGYFGAAQGVILMALLGLVMDDDLQRLNALKNVLAGIVNVVAAVLFIALTHVAWTAALLILAGSLVGGRIGAHYGRRIPPQVLRWTIVVVGTAVGLIMLLT